MCTGRDSGSALSGGQAASGAGSPLSIARPDARSDARAGAREAARERGRSVSGVSRNNTGVSSVSRNKRSPAQAAAQIANVEHFLH
jgi:hypothetical protein